MTSRHRRSSFPLAAAVLAVLPACADGGLLSFAVIGEGFADGEARVAVTQLAVDETIACATTRAVAGRFEVDFGEIMQPRVGHRVDAFVDLDGDERCEFGVDAVMSLELAPADASSDLTFPDGAMRVGDDPAGCAGFGGVSYEVAVDGVLEDHVRYALLRMSRAGAGPEKIVATGAVSASGGRATIVLEGAGQPGRQYRIDLFEASTPDAACGSTTNVFRVPTGAVGEDAPAACTPPGSAVALSTDVSALEDSERGECSSFP